MSYGPNPWQQTQWDWRAAANFICGGAGGGLIVFAALSGPLPLLLLGGVLLVCTGLLCVWLEIGRPLRAVHVFFNPRTSWLTREAFVAALLVPAALGAAAGLPGLDGLAALLALAFIYCQARILRAATGIPAWRNPLVVPLIVVTGLAEGGGLALLAQAADAPRWLIVVATLALARLGVWRAYRRGLTPQALVALDGAGRWMQLADAAALLLLVLALAASTALATPLVAGAGLLLAATGAAFKFNLIMRAGFNQGFALAHLPVRGVHRRPAHRQEVS